MTRVLPIFRQVLGEMGEVTWESGSLASLGMGLGYGVLAVLGVLILCLLGLLVWYRVRREQAEAFVYRVFPPLRRLRAMLTAARFANIMEMMLRSGFPLAESMELLDSVFPDAESRRKIETCRNALATGTPFPKRWNRRNFRPPVQQNGTPGLCRRQNRCGHGQAQPGVRNRDG